MKRRNLLFDNMLRLLVAACPFVAGCATGPYLLDGNGSSTEEEGDLPSAVLPPDKSVVDVQFVNETAAVVETQFYATNDPVEPTAEALFVPANLFMEDVGVAGLGLLNPESFDAIAFECTENLVLGVAGGAFLDPDLGTELGVGPPRIVQEGLVFDCGAMVTFTYKIEGDGYTVVVDLE